MNVAAHPRCSAYLTGMRVNVHDPAITDWQAAVIVADAAFTDDELEAAGTVSFPSGSNNERDGARILGSLEALMRDRTKMRLPKPEMEALKAFLGARGVKVSKLGGSGDFWRVAQILWPDHVKRTAKGRLEDLLWQIRQMTKKQRSTAQKHAHEIPVEFKAGGAA